MRTWVGSQGLHGGRELITQIALRLSKHAVSTASAKTCFKTLAPWIFSSCFQGLAWWFTPGTPGSWRTGQTDCSFRDSLGYTVRSCLNNDVIPAIPCATASRNAVHGFVILYYIVSWLQCFQTCVTWPETQETPFRRNARPFKYFKHKQSLELSGKRLLSSFYRRFD